MLRVVLLLLTIVTSVLACGPRPPSALPGRGMKPAKCYEQCIEDMDAPESEAMRTHRMCSALCGLPPGPPS